MRALAALAALLAATAPAFAHGAEEHAAELSWTFDPWIVTPLLISGALYATGVAALWRRAGIGRGVRGWRAGCYAGGWLSLALALTSPLHWLGEHLFTFHMIEHEIVMAISAPLIAVARPIGAMLWALPQGVRARLGGAAKGRVVRAVWRTLTKPLYATILHGAIIWGWHAPPLFDLAVVDVLAHRLQHLTFFLSALLFWWALVKRADYSAAVGHVFITMLHTGALGALMALAPRVLYRAQTAHAAEWRLTPLEDQQLAGVVMWVPAGTVYAGAALVLAALWIRSAGMDGRRDHGVRQS
jgi:cytochrome c oxidase assembly factor CtaG